MAPRRYEVLEICETSEIETQHNDTLEMENLCLQGDGVVDDGVVDDQPLATLRSPDIGVHLGHETTLEMQDDAPGSDSPTGAIGQDELSLFAINNLALAVHCVLTAYASTVYAALLRTLLIGQGDVGSNEYLNFHYSAMAPWGVACIIAFASDSFPVLGFRRKYYCLGGHLICLGVTAVMAAAHQDTDILHCFRNPDQSIVCGGDAIERATQMVVLLILAMIGIVVADTAANGAMVEASHCMEGGGGGLASKTVSFTSVPVVCLALRLAGVLLAALTLIVCSNGTPPMDATRFDVATTPLLLAVVGTSATSAASWHFLSASEGVQPHYVTCASRCHHARSLLRQVIYRFRTKPFASFMLFNLSCPAFANMVAPVGAMLQGAMLQWHDGGVFSTLTALVASAVYCLFVVVGWHWVPQCDPRHAIVVATVSAVQITMSIDLLVLFDVCTNPYLHLLRAIASEVPTTTIYFIASLVAVELAERGTEATTYSIVVSTQVLVVATTRVAVVAFYGQLPIWLGFKEWGALSNATNYQNIDTSFRSVAAMAVLTSSSFVLCSQMFVGFIPTKNDDFKYSGIHNIVAWGVIGLLVILFATGWTINLMALMPFSRCSAWLGGGGC